MKQKFTDNDWLELTRKTTEYTHKGLRLGQSYMNALCDLNKEIYDEITNSRIDPFYDNQNLLNFFTYLNNLK